MFAGRILARLEGRAPRSCGRERPPITSLDLGERDIDTEYAWGTNMAIRRSAMERVGSFDVSLAGGGDEQEWQERMRRLNPGASILYVAGAAVEHRRSGEDSTLRSLARAAHARGRAARRFDSRRGTAPSLARESATLAGCLGHVVRRRCPSGMTMAAHSAGRLREGIHERLTPSAGAPCPARAARRGFPLGRERHRGGRRCDPQERSGRRRRRTRAPERHALEAGEGRAGAHPSASGCSRSA